MIGNHVTASGKRRVDSSSADVPEEQQRYWRTDVQGLRALAVIMVVTFHAGLPFAGGFFGVDVFFVISGYVITELLLRERTRSGTIRFRSFYWRRFTRLMPALSLTVFVTVLLSLALLSPLGSQQIALGTGLAAMLVAANVFISQTSGDYFDPASELNPLLNTWSLSVEEQFYLIFPVLLVISWIGARSAVVPRRAAIAIGVIATVSLALMLVAVSFNLGTRLDTFVSPFYSPFTRAWEFAVGGLVALARQARAPWIDSRWPRIVLGVTGLGLITLAWLGVSGTAPTPGWSTFVPVVGTSLVIAAGGTAPIGPNRILGHKIFVSIGDWSYSIYLWHWPLIVFTAILMPGQPRALWVAALLSLAPAFLSYRYLETPVRKLHTPGLGARTRLVSLVMLPTLAITGLGYFLSNSVLKPRYENGDFRILTGTLGPNAWREEFTERFRVCDRADFRSYVPDWEGYEMCRQSMVERPARAAVIGDSHSQDVFVALASRYPTLSAVSLGFGGTPPFLNGSEAMRAALVSAAEDPDINVIVLSGMWDAYGGLDFDEISETVELLAEEGKHVYLTTDVPSFSFDPEQCAMRRLPVLPGSRCEETRSADNRTSQVTQDSLARLAASKDVTGLLDLHSLFCNASECTMKAEGNVLFRDRDHLTIEGARYVADALSSLNPHFDEALKGLANDVPEPSSSE